MLACSFTTFDDEMFTTAGMARFTTGAKVVSGPCSVDCGMRGVDKNGNTMCVLLMVTIERADQQRNRQQLEPPWIYGCDLS